MPFAFDLERNNRGWVASAAHPPVGHRGAVDFIIEQLLPLAPGTEEQLEAGANFLLADCGGGKALHRIGLRFPMSRFVGIDELPWNVASAASHARAAGLGNLWFQHDVPGEIEVPPVYDVVVSLDASCGRDHDPHRIVRVASAVRSGGVLFFENDNGTARSTLLAMGFRKVFEARPHLSPSRRIIVAWK